MVRLEVLDDGEALARRAADEVARIVAATPTGLRCRIALSGGRTPRRMLELLVTASIDWGRVAIYQVDERLAPLGHPDRNLTALDDLLVSRVAPAELHPMPVDDLGDYPVPVLDLVQLGLGADGHTASLVPGDPVLWVRDRDVSLSGDYQGRRRMTLTVPALDRARRRLWLVAGADKRDALRRLLRADRSIPAALVSRDQALVLADRAAAGT